MGCDARNSVQKGDLRHWWVVKTCSWRMVVAGSVFHLFCHQTVALSTKGMHESNRQTFWAQTLKVQTVNNWCLLDCDDELNICKMAQIHNLTTICTFVCVCHVPIHYLHSCTEHSSAVTVIIKCLLCSWLGRTSLKWPYCFVSSGMQDLNSIYQTCLLLCFRFKLALRTNCIFDSIRKLTVF